MFEVEKRLWVVSEHNAGRKTGLSMFLMSREAHRTTPLSAILETPTNSYKKITHR